MNNWKPGDVADTQYGLAIRVPSRCLADHRNTDDHWHTVSGGWLRSDVDARPLALIDPEDTAQVERLATLITEHDSGNLGDDWAADLAVALREFAAPTPPRPDEPTGLGAVVEDADGVLWVRHNPLSASPWSPESASAKGITLPYRPYDDINAVRVLSEGVTS